jgi:hypothetical protein
MLPKVQKAGFQEYERFGCPVLMVGGLECVAVWRVAAVLFACIIFRRNLNEHVGVKKKRCR